MFEGPVYTVLCPSLYSSCLWRKGWGLWRQYMAFSASPGEELDISLKMWQKKGMVILNSCGWVVCSTDLVTMNPVTLPMGQAFVTVTSPSCGSFPFSASYMVWHYASQCDKCPSPAHSPCSRFVPQQKQYLSCSHGVVVPQATDQHVKNPPEKDVLRLASKL